MTPPTSHTLLIGPPTHLSRDRGPSRTVSLFQQSQLSNRRRRFTNVHRQSIVTHHAVRKHQAYIRETIREKTRSFSLSRTHTQHRRTFSSSSRVHRSLRIFGLTLCLHRCAQCCPFRVRISLAISLHRFPYLPCNLNNVASSSKLHGVASRAKSRGIFFASTLPIDRSIAQKKRRFVSARRLTRRFEYRTSSPGAFGFYKPFPSRVSSSRASVARVPCAQSTRRRVNAMEGRCNARVER